MIKTKDKFYKDKWLSKQIGKDTYQLEINDFIKSDFLKTWKNFRVEHATENYFVYSKINTHFKSISKCLVDADFKLIDTNVQYELKDNNLTENQQQNGLEICFSEEKHQKALEKIARDNFFYSRFHIDNKIDDVIANQIKENWVKNYFSGNRGDEMVLALLNNEPVGFIQLIIKEKELIIDLIAVDKIAQGRGVASSMIKFANSNFKRPSVKVGTQIQNLPSTKLYKKLGFVLAQSDYVFHYHN